MQQIIAKSHDAGSSRKMRGKLLLKNREGVQDWTELPEGEHLQNPEDRMRSSNSFYGMRFIYLLIWCLNCNAGHALR